RRWAPAFLCLECRAKEEIIRQRLEERLRVGRDASDARWEIYEAQKQVFQPVTELPPDKHMVADCDEPWAQCVEEARRELKRRLAPPP
ncbi:unnamed protein product, partial [marine sediment metagenome]